MVNIEGKRICLRDWKITDLEEYEFWRNPGHEWEKYDGPYYPKTTKEEINNNINTLRQNILNNSFTIPRKTLVIADFDTDKLIGQVSWYWQGKETNWISIGIAIFNHEYWNKGIGYEAFGLWSEYLFNEMSVLSRLDFRTWSGNKGMMRLGEKLGYAKEACFRKARIVNGEYYDGLGYGVLREEWEQLYPKGFADYLKLKDKSI